MCDSHATKFFCVEVVEDQETHFLYVGTERVFEVK